MLSLVISLNSVDDIRHMVVSGLELPGPTWGDELIQQIHLARTIVTQMALFYQQAQYAVVIDDFWDENLHIDYSLLFGRESFHKIVLYPSQEKAHHRNLKRSADNPALEYIDLGIHMAYGMLETAMPQLHDEKWLILNTTELTIEATVKEILTQTEK